MSSNHPTEKPTHAAKQATTRHRPFARRIECSPDGERGAEPILPVTRKAARQPCDDGPHHGRPEKR